MTYIHRNHYNIKCDRCGKLLNPDQWLSEMEYCEEIMEDNGFRHIGRKDYCSDCWYLDEDDNIKVKPKDEH